jgi:hypothetical protein
MLVRVTALHAALMASLRVTLAAGGLALWQVVAG